MPPRVPERGAEQDFPCNCLFGPGTGTGSGEPAFPVCSLAPALPGPGGGAAGAACLQCRGVKRCRTGQSRAEGAEGSGGQMRMGQARETGGRKWGDRDGVGAEGNGED